MSLPRRPRIHVLYEHGPDLEPFSTAHIRLLRPLGHPSLRHRLDVSFGRHLPGEPLDAVIVDRLWHPAADGPRVARLLADLRTQGARLVHALDDNFLDLPLERRDWAASGQPEALRSLLTAADAFLVSTPPLAERLRWTGRPVHLLPNALDERLLAPEALDPAMPQVPAPPPGTVTLGYMGTFTHDGDLALVLPALRALSQRHGSRLRLQVLGVVGREAGESALAELPVERIRLSPDQMAYPRFLPWFTQQLHWDIGIAPLADTPFNRAKSDLKHLDYAAQGAAGAFSRVTSYRHTVRDGETGLLVPNAWAAWEDALERLIQDEALRGRLAAGARGYLLAERTLASQAARWAEALEAVVEEGRTQGRSSAVAAGGGSPGEGDPRGESGRDRHGAGAAHEARPRPGPRPLRLSVLLERDAGGRPLAPSQLRLLRPLTHPAVMARGLEARFDARPQTRGQDALVLDRLWLPDVDLPRVEALIDQARRDGVAFLYSIDDNLLDLPAERGDWPSGAHLAIVRRCLAAADGVLVSSAALAERLRPLVRGRLEILPNALDERLLPPWRHGRAEASGAAAGSTGPGAGGPVAGAFGQGAARADGRPLTIGYMGTATHDADLALVLPALQELQARHGARLRFQVIGGARQRRSREAWRAAGLAVSFLRPWPTDEDYASFLPWFLARADWDIAMAPLGDTPFRRCKSDIKFLDYCALESAALLSDVAPYQASVQAGRTGLLTPNRPEAWLESLEHLVAAPDLRAELGRGAWTYLHRERTLAVRAADWNGAFRRLLGLAG